MRIEGQDDWINPMFPETWECQHPHRPPGHTTLYVIFNLDDPATRGKELDPVLYVGITSDVRRRFKQHRSGRTWFPHSENAVLECYDSWDDACEAERSRIATWNPIYNIVHNHRDDLPVCDVCDGVIFGVYPEDVGKPYLQHDKCNESVSDAWAAGRRAGHRDIYEAIKARPDPWTALSQIATKCDDELLYAITAELT